MTSTPLYSSFKNKLKISRLYLFLLIILFRFALKHKELNVCKSSFISFIFVPFYFILIVIRSIVFYNWPYCMYHCLASFVVITSDTRVYLWIGRVDVERCWRSLGRFTVGDVNGGGNRSIVQRYLLKLTELTFLSTI